MKSRTNGCNIKADLPCDVQSVPCFIQQECTRPLPANMLAAALFSLLFLSFLMR